MKGFIWKQQVARPQQDFWEHELTFQTQRIGTGTKGFEQKSGGGILCWSLTQYMLALKEIWPIFQSNFVLYILRIIFGYLKYSCVRTYVHMTNHAWLSHNSISWEYLHPTLSICIEDKRQNKKIKGRTKNWFWHVNLCLGSKRPQTNHINWNLNVL